MALGIWLYILPPAIAVPLVLICSVSSQISTLPSMWKLLDFKLALPFVAGGLLGMPIGALLVARADPQVLQTQRRRDAAGVSDRAVFHPQADGVSFRRPARPTPPSDLPAASLAALPACRARFRPCGRAYAAGPRISAAAFSRSSTAPCSAPPCACRSPTASSKLNVFWLALLAMPGTLIGARLGMRTYQRPERPKFLRRRAGAAVSVRARTGVEQHCSELAAHGRHVLRVDCCTLSRKAANPSRHEPLPASRERLGLLLGFVGMVIFGGTLPATRIAVSAN